MTDDPKRLRRFQVALLGGLRLQGKRRLGDRLTRIALIGGMDLDLAGSRSAAARSSTAPESPDPAVRGCEVLRGSRRRDGTSRGEM